MEVVIPPKRNKLKKSFGFARFKGGEDARVLAVKLDNVIIDENKIHVNLPRFNRNEGEGRVGAESSKRVERRGYEVGIPRGQIKRETRRQGTEKSISYVDAVSNRVLKEDTRTEAEAFSYEAKEVDINRLKKAFVGVVHQSGMSYNIQNSFELEGYFSIKVTPLGANLCLLEEVEDGEISNLIREGKSWWSQWFSEIRVWKEE